MINMIITVDIALYMNYFSVYETQKNLKEIYLEWF